MSLRLNTPLCPAGHLPRKGGDRLSIPLSPISNVRERARPAKLPISSLAGEMSGRTEGGVTERGLRGFVVTDIA
ncbi:MAG: lytic murein transglycosylase [Mesorhizobium sp.]|nr:MAG: lytic murein transglycosylase [Mesorhizobium sp.]